VWGVPAVDEWTAAEALERIRVELEPLPFVIDPLDSLRPGGPNARLEGNVGGAGVQLQTLKWTASDFAAAGRGMPTGEAAAEWSYGDLEEAFAQSAVVIDESFVTQSMSHHSMETRSAMAYWQNGRCYLYGSTQSSSFAHPQAANLAGVGAEDLVLISETCGGGFGSKGGAYPAMGIPAHLSRQTGRPCMLRITRAEEYYLGCCRPGFQGRVRMGFREDGRMLAMDLYIVQANGPYSGFGDFRSAGNAVSILYQPVAMRWRGIPVLTNTPPVAAQRGPGENQISNALEPLVDRAARELGIDPVAIRRLNAPDNDGRIGANRGPLTSAYLREALEMGAERFGWAEKIQESGRREGSKVTGVGVGIAYHSAGASGFDGLLRIDTDGIVHIHTGVGNLGTFSHSATSRIAAEVLKCDWENCVIERGDSRRHLPWNLGQFGSNTSFTMARTNYVAAMDVVQKLKEIAAMYLGGSPEDYDIG
jgi:xanthine dehydrogenase molybdenum-binding subunit